MYNRKRSRSECNTKRHELSQPNTKGNEYISKWMIHFSTYLLQIYTRKNRIVFIDYCFYNRNTDFIFFY